MDSAQQGKPIALTPDDVARANALMERARPPGAWRPTEPLKATYSTVGMAPAAYRQYKRRHQWKKARRVARELLPWVVFGVPLLWLAIKTVFYFGLGVFAGYWHW